jgi:hypothetical protein
MAPALLDRLQVVRALVADPQLSTALTARVKLIQSLVKNIIEHIEQQQADQLTAKRTEQEG